MRSAAPWRSSTAIDERLPARYPAVVVAAARTRIRDPHQFVSTGLSRLSLWGHAACYLRFSRLVSITAGVPRISCRLVATPKLAESGQEQTPSNSRAAPPAF